MKDYNLLTAEEINKYIRRMQLGTISYKELPVKQKLYENDGFYIYPVIFFGNQPTIILRPCYEFWDREEGYKFDLEGEFSFSNSAVKPIEKIKDMLLSDKYFKITYVALSSDLESIDEEIKRYILSWVDRVI